MKGDSYLPVPLRQGVHGRTDGGRHKYSVPLGQMKRGLAGRLHGAKQNLSLFIFLL